MGDGICQNEGRVFWVMRFDVLICIINQMQQMLRQENYQLKNEITDLKNAFDLNRDILKILSTYNTRNDPEYHLLLQIINRLTTVNNQAMLNCIELIQEKNILKQENLRLNLEAKTMEQRMAIEVENNRLCNHPNQSKLLMQEQFNSLNKELLAANEERIAKDQEIEYWKQKYAKALASEEPRIQQNQSTYETTHKNNKIKRKYQSNSNFKYQILFRQAEKDIKRLKRYIDELESRLFVFIKAFNVKEDSLTRKKTVNREDSFESQKEEIRLLKYALNSINVERKHDEYVMSITERFRDRDQMNNSYVKDRRNASWPKNYITRQAEDTEEDEFELKFHREVENRMEERQY